MADPLSIACGVLALATFALSSSASLAATIRSFKSHNKHTRALLDELHDLAIVLESLSETIKSNPNIDFDALKHPLDRCGNSCKEYGELLARFTKHSTDSHASIRDWLKQRYMQGDVADFKDMLAGYKATMNIAIANVNIRVAAITPGVLEDYKSLIATTNQELEEHLEDIDEKIQALSSDESSVESDHNSAEWRAILEEKSCTQQGLDMCARLSAQIDNELEPALEANWSSSGRPPEAQEHVKNGLSATQASLQTMRAELHAHEDTIERRILDLKATKPMSTQMAAELQRLRAEKDAIGGCMRLVATARGDAEIAERHNVFEDIHLADSSFSFTVSTFGELVTARRINLSGGSCNVGGQISDESFIAAVENLTRNGQRSVQDTRPASSATRVEKRVNAGFQDRYGPGVQLEPTSPAMAYPPVRA